MLSVEEHRVAGLGHHQVISTIDHRDNKLCGLYILESSILINVLQIFKFGMSMRLEYRWFDYYDIWTDAKYYCIFIIKNLTDKKIKFLEGEILKETKDYKKEGMGNEFRTGIIYEDFIKITEKILKSYGIVYIIDRNCKFDKPKIMINENTDEIEPEILEKIPENVPNKKKLKEDQVLCKKKADEYYSKNNKGMIVVPCGYGKTIVGIEISTKFVKNYLLIGVYSLGLIEQWIEDLIIYYDFPILIISSIKIDNYKNTTNENVIKKWIQENKNGIIITSYQSSNKLLNINIKFDFSIFDEVHHLCGYIDNDKKQNLDILSLSIDKQLGLTATIKEIDNTKEHIDNKNIEYFGNIIHERSILWAIENKYITDYHLVFPKISFEEFEDKIKNNIDNGISYDDYYLCLSAYIGLLSIKNNRHKILIFTNKINDTVKLYNYVQILNAKIFKLDIPFIQHTNNDGCDINILKNQLDKNVDKGILITVYKVGEGINIPTLDTILISDNMESWIRIIQAALRGNRIDENNLDKIAQIIIPMIYEDDPNFNYEEGDFKSKTFPMIRKVIDQMGSSDDIILSRVKTFNLTTTGDPSIKPILEFKEDVELDHDLKLKIISRTNYGRRNIRYMKNTINQMGGLLDSNISMKEDYRLYKQNKNGLPEYNYMQEHLIRNKKTWFELYNIDISSFPEWEEFNNEWKYKSRDEYKRSSMNSDRIPNINDLDERYPNYNMSFWKKGSPPPKKKLIK